MEGITTFTTWEKHWEECKLKRMLSILLCFMLLFTTSCSKIKNQNPKILNRLKKEVKYQRIIITSTRLAGKYTIFDDGAKKISKQNVFV